MVYQIKSPHVLFSSCLDGLASEFPSLDKDATVEFCNAVAWLEAENIFAVFQLIIAWFKLMESGEAANRYPSPGGTVTQEQADLLISELDADFAKESNRWPVDAEGKAWGPEFSRLLPHSRRAFAEEIRAILKTEAQILAEALERLAKGEKLPPVRQEG